MNIEALKQEAERQDGEVEVAVKDAAGKPYKAKDGSPVVFVVVGEYAKRFRENERPVIDRRINRSPGDEEPSNDEIERRIAESVACGVVGWRGVETPDGTPVPFSLENCTQVFVVAPWIRKQVEHRIRGHALFFGVASVA